MADDLAEVHHFSSRVRFCDPQQVITDQQEHEVSSHDNDQQPESAAPVSERKRRANQENARHSTGPRTAAGKQASSMNALKHGAFATMSVAISRGAFAEDPDELEGYIADIVESLRPRDAAEREEAKRVAIAYLRAHRLGRYEAELLSGPRHDDDTVVVERSKWSPEEEYAAARAFKQVLDGEVCDPGAINHELLLHHMRAHKEDFWLRTGVDIAREPEDVRKLPIGERFRWQMKHGFKSERDCVMFASIMLSNAENRLNAHNQRSMNLARGGLTSIDRVSVTSQRISRDLDQALRRFLLLQKRPLPDESGGSRETNPPHDE